MSAIVENPSEMEKLEIEVPTFLNGIEEKISVDTPDEGDKILYLPIELDGTELPYERRRLLHRMIRKYEPEQGEDETSVFTERPHRHSRHEDRFWDPKDIPHRVLMAELPTDGFESKGFIKRPQDRDYDAVWRNYLLGNERSPFAVPVFEAVRKKEKPERYTLSDVEVSTDEVSPNSILPVEHHSFLDRPISLVRSALGI